jgi:2-keto-4-pentenoate hydratase
MSAEAMVAALADAHAKGIQIQAEAPVRDAAQAYEVQRGVWRRLHGAARPRAWKVGTPNAQTEPTASPVIALHESPCALPGSRFHRIGLEAEVAYRLGRDLPPRDAAYSDEEIADAIVEVVVAIEICDTRLANWATAAELWKLADFQNNGALVAGSGTAHWRAIDFRAQRAELIVDGAPRADVTGAHPLGDPFRLMPWAVAHCAHHFGGLRKGDLVTTGSWGGVHYAAPGCDVHARFEGIGEAAVRIELR